MLGLRTYRLLAVSLTLAGCSNHPLPNRVTGYTSADLVKKLRCEAQEAILVILQENEWVEAHEKILKAAEDDEKLKIIKSNKNDIFSAYNKILTEYNARKKQLDDKRTKIVIEGGEIANTIISITKSITNSQIEKERLFKKYIKEIITNNEIEEFENDGNGNIITLLNKKQKKDIEEMIRKYNQAASESNEALQQVIKDNVFNYMKDISNSKIVDEIILNKRLSNLKNRITVLKSEVESIDMSLNELEQSKNNSISPANEPQKYEKVIKYIKKEKNITNILSAKQQNEHMRNLFKFNNNSISLKLQFDITENNDAVAKATLNWPKTLGFVKLGFDAEKKKQRYAVRVIDTVSTFLELSDYADLECQQFDDVRRSNRARNYPLKGKVGIDELIYQYYDISKSTRLNSEPQAFTDKIEFTTLVKGGINPVVEIRRFIPHIMEAGVDVDVMRKDVHTVNVQISPYAGPKKAPSGDTLNIVGLPQVRVLKEIVSDDGGGRPIRVD